MALHLLPGHPGKTHSIHSLFAAWMLVAFACANATATPPPPNAKPRFCGEGAESFAQWVGEHLVYPDSCEQRGEEGCVKVRFSVEADGSVGDVTVIEGVTPALDQEAVRVVSSSPKWEPGRRQGMPARFSFTFPIQFVSHKGEEVALADRDGVTPPVAPDDISSRHAADTVSNASNKQRDTKPKVLGDVLPQMIEEALQKDEDCQLLEKPRFKWKGSNAFSQWVNERLRYPAVCKKNRIEGKVILKFSVEEDGSVSNVEVLQGVHWALDQEAVRVVKLSPKWEPAIINGRPAKVNYTFPVIFHLR